MRERGRNRFIWENKQERVRERDECCCSRNGRLECANVQVLCCAVAVVVVVVLCFVVLLAAVFVMGEWMTIGYYCRHFTMAS